MSPSRVDKILWNDFELDFSHHCAVMGILNLTSDSFSDGGLYQDIDAAVAHGMEMAGYGADIIDIGPESSRPGSKRLSAEVQTARAVPVIKQLAGSVNIPISIDTYDASVARAAIEAGASIINDITAGDCEGMFELAAEKKVPIILMHMQGSPEKMQESPVYGDVTSEVLGFLLDRAVKAEEKGVDRNLIILDPGIGFGKTIEHNLALIRDLDKFVESGYAVLLGASRKRFIGQITGKEKACDRVAGTVATSVLAQIAGVQIVRVHDVQENLDALKVAGRILNCDKS
ncbi:MAG: dihydropteroate synthase [Sedimentisphaeraceae bacterium JB056]